MRWQQFDAFVSGGAPMPEPGFAWALYYQVAGNPAAGRKAIEWARRRQTHTDARQLALIFDWCASLMTKSQADRIAAKLGKSLAAGLSGDSRNRTGGRWRRSRWRTGLPDQGEAVLKGDRPGVVARRRGASDEAGQPIPREQIYLLYEMMHAIRDNLKIDLRESALEYFKSLPIDHLVGHYPAPFEAAENEYRVPVYVRDGEPDLNDAVFSRAAELAMVAYDNNAAKASICKAG